MLLDIIIFFQSHVKTAICIIYRISFALLEIFSIYYIASNTLQKTTKYFIQLITFVSMVKADNHH